MPTAKVLSQSKPTVTRKSTSRPVAPTSARQTTSPTAKPSRAAPKVALSPVAAEAPRPTKTGKSAKPTKLRKKPVRDSFTMPEADFALIATLKARTLSAKRATKKSELLRAGLHALAALDTRALLAALEALDPVKIGRPKAE